MPGRGVVVTTLAEGDAGGRRWRLDAWRAAQGERRVFCRGSWQGQRWDEVAGQHGEWPVSAVFCQHDASDASLLFGSVGEGVEAVVVEPARPVNRPARQAAIVSADGFGRFFAVAFAEPVELAEVRVEPAERFRDRSTAVVNGRLARRRQSAESVELGRGLTPANTSWRLRLWRPYADTPEHLHVDLVVSPEDPAMQRLLSGLIADGHGYGGLAMPAEQVVACRMWSGGSANRYNHIVGEVVSAVARVVVRLDDGTAVDAQIVRTDVVPNDFFVAFYPATRQPVSVVALDEQDRRLGQHDLERRENDPPA